MDQLDSCHTDPEETAMVEDIYLARIVAAIEGDRILHRKITRELHESIGIISDDHL